MATGHKIERDALMAECAKLTGQSVSEFDCVWQPEREAARLRVERDALQARCDGMKQIVKFCGRCEIWMDGNQLTITPPRGTDMAALKAALAAAGRTKMTSFSERYTTEANARRGLQQEISDAVEGVLSNVSDDLARRFYGYDKKGEERP